MNLSVNNDRFPRPTNRLLGASNRRTMSMDESFKSSQQRIRSQTKTSESNDSDEEKWRPVSPLTCLEGCTGSDFKQLPANTFSVTLDKSNLELSSKDQNCLKLDKNGLQLLNGQTVEDTQNDNQEMITYMSKNIKCTVSNLEKDVITHQSSKQLLDTRHARMAARKSVKELYGRVDWWGEEVEAAKPTNALPFDIMSSVVNNKEQSKPVELQRDAPSHDNFIPTRRAEAFTVNFEPPSRKLAILPTDEKIKNQHVPQGLNKSFSNSKKIKSNKIVESKIFKKPITTLKTNAQKNPSQQMEAVTLSKYTDGRSTPTMQRILSKQNNFPTKELKISKQTVDRCTPCKKGNKAPKSSPSIKNEDILPKGRKFQSNNEKSSLLTQRNRIPLRNLPPMVQSPCREIKPIKQVNGVATMSIRDNAASVSTNQGGKPFNKSQISRQSCRSTSFDIQSNKINKISDTRRKSQNVCKSVVTKASPSLPKVAKSSHLAQKASKHDVSSKIISMPNSKKQTSVLPIGKHPYNAARTINKKENIFKTKNYKPAIHSQTFDVAETIWSYKDPKYYLFDQMFNGINMAYQCSTTNVFQEFEADNTKERNDFSQLCNQPIDDVQNCKQETQKYENEENTAFVSQTTLPEYCALTWTRRKLPADKSKANTTNQDTELSMQTPQLEESPLEIVSNVNKDYSSTVCLDKPTYLPNVYQDSILLQATSIDSLVHSLAETYIIDTNDTLIDDNTSSVIHHNIMETSNTQTVPINEAERSQTATPKDSLECKIAAVPLCLSNLNLSHYQPNLNSITSNRLSLKLFK